MKAAVLVNGIPASGKSTVAKALGLEAAWPLLALDTIKEALFNHLGTGDRDHNRKLGKASYEAIFASVEDFPEESTTLIDAWFGFQPFEVLQGHLARARITHVVEVWCHAPPEVIGQRYASRLEKRSTGHLGADYVPELVELARRATPLGKFAVVDVDTTQPLAVAVVLKKIKAVLSGTS